MPGVACPGKPLIRGCVLLGVLLDVVEYLVCTVTRAFYLFEDPADVRVAIVDCQSFLYVVVAVKKEG